MVADFVTGTYKAFYYKSLDADEAFKGFCKKMVGLIMIAVAYRCDVLMNADGMIRMIAVYGYCGSELYSIVENAIAVKAPIPAPLLKYFKKYAKELSEYEQ